jgi:hypothetical protein
VNTAKAANPSGRLRETRLSHLRPELGSTWRSKGIRFAARNSEMPRMTAKRCATLSSERGMPPHMLAMRKSFGHLRLRLACSVARAENTRVLPCLDSSRHLPIVRPHTEMPSCSWEN